MSSPGIFVSRNSTSEAFNSKGSSSTSVDSSGICSELSSEQPASMIAVNVNQNREILAMSTGLNFMSRDCLLKPSKARRNEGVSFPVCPAKIHSRCERGTLCHTAS